MLKLSNAPLKKTKQNKSKRNKTKRNQNQTENIAKKSKTKPN